MKAPHYSSIRQWILRLGYHELHKPINYLKDWAYILDYSVSVGKRKCFVVLGVSLSHFREQGCQLNYEDVEVLAIELPEQNSGAFVYQTLESVHARVGPPLQVVSDNGSDVHKGVQQFIQTHNMFHFTYDVTHLLANLLKAHLEKNPHWIALLKAISSCKKKVQQTGMAFLSPPSIRHRSRFLNLDRVVHWAYRIVDYLKANDFSAIEPKLGRRKCLTDYTDKQLVQLKRRQFFQKFDWVEAHMDFIKECHGLVQVTKAINTKIKNEGLSRKTIMDIEQMVKDPALPLAARNVGHQAIEVLYKNLPPYGKQNDVFLGTSDIIESLFGKYKYFKAEGALVGYTKTVLNIAAFTAKLSIQKISEAMEGTTEKMIQEWSHHTIGETLFAKRNRCLSKPNVA